MSQTKRPIMADKGQMKSAIKRILGYEVKYFPVPFFLSLFCVIVSCISNAANSMFIGTIFVDDILANISDPDILSRLAMYLGIMAGIYLCGIVSIYFYNFLMSKVAQGTQKKIRDELFEHMQTLPLSYFDTRTRGDIMSVYTNDVDTLREAMSRAWPMLVSATFSIIVVGAMMFITNWMLAIIVILLTIPMFFFTRAVTKSSGKYFVKQQISLGKTNGYVEEMINGQKVVKVFNHEEEAIAGFNVLNDKLCEESTKANRYSNVLMPVINQAGTLQYIILGIIASVLLVYKDNLGSFEAMFSVGTVVSFLMYSKSFTQPIGVLSQQINLIVMAVAGATRIFEMIDTPSEVDDGYVTLVNAKEDENGNPVEVAERTGKWAWKHPHESGGVTYTWLRGRVTFNDVDFGYVPGKIVLHNVTLYAEPGQKVAFVGPTGAGKTTITNLINRFYDIADGKVRYDEININKIKKADLRRSLGMVLQDTELFTGTVKDNIKFGKLDATDEEVIEAAKLANAHTFISNLPNGYDTMLEKAGGNLSQGQRQLIAIARAAISNPPAMILDEATSSIDSRTEEMVQKGMDAIMKGRTVFVIAHRLSTVKNSDVIMVLDQGSIIERGSHDQLIAMGGKYYQLYTGNAMKK